MSQVDSGKGQRRGVVGRRHGGIRKLVAGRTRNLARAPLYLETRLMAAARVLVLVALTGLSDLLFDAAKGESVRVLPAEFVAAYSRVRPPSIRVQQPGDHLLDHLPEDGQFQVWLVDSYHNKFRVMVDVWLWEDQGCESFALELSYGEAGQVLSKRACDFQFTYSHNKFSQNVQYSGVDQADVMGSRPAVQFQHEFYIPAPELLACAFAASAADEEPVDFGGTCRNEITGTLRNASSGLVVDVHAVKFVANPAAEAHSELSLTLPDREEVCRADLLHVVYNKLHDHVQGGGGQEEIQAIELGVASGQYSETLLRFWNTRVGLGARGFRLFSVDAWGDSSRDHDVREYFQVLQRLAIWGNSSVVMRASFDEALSVFPDNFFHFVYIDGYAHQGNDGVPTLRKWHAKVRPGGVLAGHDYDLFRWPRAFHNVNVFANALRKTVYVTGDCAGDGFPSWAIFK